VEVGFGVSRVEECGDGVGNDFNECGAVVVCSEASEEQVGGEGEREPAPGATRRRIGGFARGVLLALAGPIGKAGAGPRTVGHEEFTGDVAEEFLKVESSGVFGGEAGIGVGWEPEEIAEGDEFVDRGVWELGEEIDLSETPQLLTCAIDESAVQMFYTQPIRLAAHDREGDNLGNHMVERDIDRAVIGHGGRAREELDGQAAAVLCRGRVRDTRLTSCGAAFVSSVLRTSGTFMSHVGSVPAVVRRRESMTHWN
jgi:hypothetical protein